MVAGLARSAFAALGWNDSVGGAPVVIEELAQSRLGERYVLGAKVPKDDPNWHGPWDCAEFASWLVFQAYGKLVGVRNGDAYTGFWWADAQAGRARKLSVDEAKGRPCTFLLRIPRQGVTGHIALVTGPNQTIEAHSARRGVCKGVIVGRRWDCGVAVD